MRALFLAAALAVAPSAASAADWVKAESPNFVVYSDVSPDLVREQVQLLELFDRVLRIKLGVEDTEPTRRKLPVYLLRSKRDFAKIRPGIDQDIAGFYSANPEDIFAVADFDREQTDYLLHEYVHHFMLARFPYGYPGWLIEGYAEYFMTFEQKGAHVRIGDYNTNRAQWLMSAPWMPFERVLTARPSDLQRDDHKAMYYAQAWALTHYMLSDPARQKQLDAYIRAIAGGAEPLKAWKAATGDDAGSLTNALRRYLNKFPVQQLTLPPTAAAPVKVTPLTSGLGDVLLVTQRVKGDNGVDAPTDRTDGPVLLAAARTAAARLPGVREAELLQARAELKLGDLAVADRLLRARLAADPNDAEAAEVAALARLKAAEQAPPAERAAVLAEARSFAGRAHKADPDRYQTLSAYLQGRQGAADYPNDNDLNVVRDALDLAPQVAELRLAAAEAYMKQRKYKQAAAVLAPVAQNPHGGSAAGAARKLVALLDTMSPTTGPAGTPSAPASGGTTGAP